MESEMMAMYEPELHPLKNKWVLWYLEKDEKKEWRDCLQVVREVHTIEDYWNMIYTNVSPGNLKHGSDYCFFKEGVLPMWEDVHNVYGGRWLIEIAEKKTPQETSQLINRLWHKLSFAMVTDKLKEHDKNICGAVVNLRNNNNNKISLWTRDAKNDEVNLKIGQIVKSELSIPDSAIMKYQIHENFLVGINYFAKPRLCIPAKERVSQAEVRFFASRK